MLVDELRAECLNVLVERLEEGFEGMKMLRAERIALGAKHFGRHGLELHAQGLGLLLHGFFCMFTLGIETGACFGGTDQRGLGICFGAAYLLLGLSKCGL